MTETARTKAKINENLGLLIKFFEKKYDKPVDDDTRMILYNALDWTAEDVERQDEDLLKIATDQS